MSRSLALLQGRLVSDGEPGLSPIDSRLSTITELAERRSFSEAADRAEALLTEGVFDIRPISIYLYQVFIEGGFDSLAEIFVTAGELLGESREAIGPAKRREDHFDRRLSWLFETTADALEYHAVKGTPEWARWHEGLAPESVAGAATRADALLPRLDAEGFPTASASLGRVIAWLRSHAAQLRALLPPPAAAPKAPLSLSPPPADQALADGPLEPVRRRVELTVSHAFIELWCKLQAFEALIERQEYEKAALVCDDVMAALDAFDPRAYFPELFGRFSALMSQNIGTLAGHWGDRDSPSWKALSQYYQVDRKGFVGG